MRSDGGLFSLKRTLRDDLTAVYNFMRERVKGGADLISLVSGDRT